jgi:type III secretory pathway component EscV
MSIDADLNAGLIDENKARGANLSAEAEFGAMDGAAGTARRRPGTSLSPPSYRCRIPDQVFQNGMDMKRALTTYTI